MKRTVIRALLLAALCVFAAVCLSACGKKSKEPELTMAEAQTILEGYLAETGFGDDDFLAEGTMQEINGEQAYAFSWREKVNDSADKLSGMYAISCDGKSVYEYQASRGEWVKAASL